MAAQSVGIEDCGCEERKEYLNKKVPYDRKDSEVLQGESWEPYKAEKNATPLEKKKHATRVEARKIMKAKPGQVVDHKKTLAKGGSNSRSNLRIVSAHTNNTKNKK